MKIIVFSPTSTVLSLTAEQPLGGADSILLKLIEILARENEVEAYLPIKKETSGEFRGAKCYPFMELFDEPRECDIIIHNRKVFPIPNTMKYKQSVFYSQDTHDTPCFSGLKGNRKALDMFDRIWVLSHFHKQDFLKIFDIPEEKFFILGNAAPDIQLGCKEWIENYYEDGDHNHRDDIECGSLDWNKLPFLCSNCEKTPLQFIYSSTPFRGLDVLLKAWTKIIVKYPTATLHIFSSMKIYGAEELDDLHFGKMFSDMKNGRFKNLIFHGSVPQAEMFECMKKSFMLLYPNTYPETYCNVIMESRACRTPFITTDLGSLKETGSPAGCFIEGNARSPEYMQKFLDTLDFVIADNEFYKTLQKNCYPIRSFKDYAEDLLIEINRLNSRIKD